MEQEKQPQEPPKTYGPVGKSSPQQQAGERRSSPLQSPGRSLSPRRKDVKEELQGDEITDLNQAQAITNTLIMNQAKYVVNVAVEGATATEPAI